MHRDWRWRRSCLAIARPSDPFVETTMHLFDFVHKNIFVH